MKHSKRSEELYKAAQERLPGGVSSPVRAFKAVGGSPLFMARGEGSHIYDADDNAYIDYVCSWGPLVLGHGHPQVASALKKAVDNGTSFGASTELEITLAEMISEAVPSMEMLRFVNSGTEATMSVLRLARAYTGRDKVIKFAGCYHGHADGLLVKSGSGLATLGIPDCPGVPSGYAENTLVAPYNDLEAVGQIFANYPEQVAAVIVEPVAANMGVVLPKDGFLQGLRSLTEKAGALLIFDEVLVGFRAARGGAQSVYNVQPDLTCLGKIIGGGLPVGAYGGRREVMKMIAPSGPVYQAGTLSGNPLAMTAGIETLKILAQPGIYEQLEAKGAILEQGIREASSGGIKVSRIGSLLTVFFTDGPVEDYDGAAACDTERFAAFFRALLAEGIYWPPSQFEAAFVSLAHSDEDIERTVAAVAAALKAL